MPVMDDAKIIKKARNYIRTYGTRDPECLARELGVRIHDADFIKLKGVYKVILRNPFIFIKKDLDPVTRKIVLLHELGHHALHRKEAQIFQEFSLNISIRGTTPQSSLPPWSRISIWWL